MRKVDCMVCVCHLGGSLGLAYSPVHSTLVSLRSPWSLWQLAIDLDIEMHTIETVWTDPSYLRLRLIM